MTLAKRSLSKLEGVHPDLVHVVHQAASDGCAFHVTEGLRTLERQKGLVAAGKSKTLKSRHLTGHAVDVVAVMPDGSVSYDDDDMARVAVAMKAAATACGVKIEWGGDWKGAWDSPHFQLPAKGYPSDSPGHTATAVVLPPERPLSRSGTIWGGAGTLAAGGAAYADEIVAGSLEWTAKLTEVEPVKVALLQAGGNAKALALGLGVMAGLVVIARRVKAAREGRSG